MFAVNYTSLRDNMRSYFDRVADSYETMIVTRKEENMVVMSQSTYDSMMETIYLLGNPANAAHLTESIKQHKAGKVQFHEIIEGSND